MSDTVIKVENISKQYRLGNVGLGTIGADLNRWWQTSIRGNEDPYLKIGEENDRSLKGESDYVWALRDINFEVKQGEVLGIIGRNGAGKSTLLKILSRTTTPTTGQIKIKGRVASLLEVGTGFHPELTGRENIFLNGAILGMTKSEIKSKFDEIVDFAGVERYIDTPVKRYSSGMYVRLAFGVAAHLEPEILIVDEVLAVGDAEFQKKALGKMKDISQGQGRTVLFVSHNMAAVRSLCTKGIILKNGLNWFQGDIEHTVSNYFQVGTNNESLDLVQRTDREGNGNFIFNDIRVFDTNGKETESVFCNDQLTIEIHFGHHDIDLSRVIVTVGFKDPNFELVAFFSTDEIGFKLNENTNSFKLVIPELGLRPGLYSVWLFSSYDNTSPKNFCDVIEDAKTIEVLPIDYWISGKTIRSRHTAFFNGSYIQ